MFRRHPQFKIFKMEHSIEEHEKPNHSHEEQLQDGDKKHNPQKGFFEKHSHHFGDKDALKLVCKKAKILHKRCKNKEEVSHEDYLDFYGLVTDFLNEKQIKFS